MWTFLDIAQWLQQTQLSKSYDSSDSLFLFHLQDFWPLQQLPLVYLFTWSDTPVSVFRWAASIPKSVAAPRWLLRGPKDQTAERNTVDWTHKKHAIGDSQNPGSQEFLPGCTQFYEKVFCVGQCKNEPQVHSAQT